MKNHQTEFGALQEIESLTLSHYNDNAIQFYEGTKDHDVSQNYDAFLGPLLAGEKAGVKLDILDFGCGPGRDLQYFRSLGHRPVGLDGSEKLCGIAQKQTDCRVLCQSFLNLSLASNAYDGVFANASLFHVPKSQLTNVLNIMNQALRKEGILFMSNPRGDREGWSGRRYGNFMEFDVIKEYLNNAEFRILDHYYRPTNLPVKHRPWLAIVCQK